MNNNAFECVTHADTLGFSIKNNIRCHFKIGAFVGGGVCGLVLERISTALLPWGMSGEYAVVSEGLSFEYVFAKIVDMDRRHRWLTSTSLFAKVYSDQILDEGIHPLSVSADVGLKISIDYKK